MPTGKAAASAGRPTEKPRSKSRSAVLWRTIKSYKYFYLMLLPVLAWYIIFCYGPMYGVITAFQDYSMSRGVFRSPFVGLQHFRTLFDDTLFWRAFRNSAILAVYRIIFEFPIPIILSILINELRSPLVRKFTQTLLYLPHFLSWVIVASISSPSSIQTPVFWLLLPGFSAPKCRRISLPPKPFAAFWLLPISERRLAGARSST